MVDAPEKIYADRGPHGGWMYRLEKMTDTQHIYVRADIAEPEKEELRTKLDVLTHDCDGTIRVLRRQLAERDADLARKDAALKPFADVCGYFDGHVKDDDDISIALRSIKARHVRTARAALAGSGDGWPVLEGCLDVGHQVTKSKGYPFPGEVRAAFKTRAGLLRYVIEATGADYAGMLHIFSPDQIEAAPASPSTAGER